MNADAINSMLEWSQEREVPTKYGPRLVRSADPSEAFWALWRVSQRDLKDAGYSVSQYQGKWQVSHWRKLDHATVASRQANEAASRAADSSISIPAPTGLDYFPFQKAGVEFALRVFGDLT